MWRVEGDPRVGIQAILLNVGDDANHREPRVVVSAAPQPESLANRISVGPVSARPILVYYGDLERFIPVLLIEETPFDQWDFHCFEIAGAGDSLIGLDGALSGRRIVILNGNATPTDASSQRQN